MRAQTITATELAARSDAIARGELVVFDCRFSLADPAAGRGDYFAGHIPGAQYLHLDNDLSGSIKAHGGRHPLPAIEAFQAMLAARGVGPTTAVVAYDDHGFAFASRLWWLMGSLGYRPPQLLDGGFRAWVEAGGELSCSPPKPAPSQALLESPQDFTGYCDIDGLRDWQQHGARLVDSRDEPRYAGREEPIDPVAGHIPGAVNRPWADVTTAGGALRPAAELRAHFDTLLQEKALVLYCGSGVTACVNLFALSLLGRADAVLYAGGWSDWCSYLPAE